MKSLLQLLGLGGDDDRGEAGGDTATVRKIVAELDGLPPERARYVAAFAYLLGRVANADLDISATETAKMEALVRRHGDLPEEQALLVVQIAKSQNRLFGGTENFQVAREFRQLASRERCLELLHCLFAVSAADDEISGAEESQMRMIAEELGFSHREYIDVRSQYSAQRSVMKRVQKVT